MSFKIENPRRVVQMATNGSSTYYVGQIVTYIAASKAVCVGGAVLPLAVPAGAADTTNFQIPAGVVVGINNRTPVYGATLKANSVTGVTTQATQLARDWALNKGMYAIGDPQVLVDVAIIEPCSLIEGPIYNAAYGTAPTVVTDTGGADTTGYTSAGTTGACDFTPVADYATIYCRTGANAGLYRVTSDTSTTAPAVTVGFPYDVAAGDTFVRVPVKQGYSRIYINGPGMYIDAALTPATNYFAVFVEKLDLSVAGSEKALFRFANIHFDPMRA
jgi:hypothetical protein